MTLPRSTPERQGVEPRALLAAVDALVANPELHSIVVVRHGHVVAEGWAHPFAADRPHVLYSLSKSFTSSAVGFAVAEGRFGLDDRVVGLLPDKAPDGPDERLARLTVRHLLTMTSGHDPEPPVLDGDGDWVADFLATPLVHEPGTHFVYNTPATHVLAAIVERTTGEHLLDYLTPRLLAPLGITGATTEVSPQGIATGGFGMSVRTQDIAVFAQLYLQGGVWEGRQLLPEGWAAQATKFQVPNGDPAEPSDWTQGYGFQFWRSRHGFRGDGAFGQFALVLPDEDTVVAVTSSVPDMQVSLDAIWTHLLPGLHDEPVPDDPDGRAALARRLATLRLDPPAGTAVTDTARRLSGRTVAVDANLFGLTEAVLVADDEVDEWTLRFGTRERVLRAGHDEPVAQRVPQVFSPRQSLAALVSGTWIAPDRYVLTVRWVETATTATFTFDVDGDHLTAVTRQRGSFGPEEYQPLTGVAAS